MLLNYQTEISAADPSNEDGFSFLPGKNLAGRCPDYSLSVTAVTEGNSNPAANVSVYSQHFKILSSSNPTDAVGTALETVTTVSASGTEVAATVAINLEITAPSTLLWQQSTATTSLLARHPRRLTQYPRTLALPRLHPTRVFLASHMPSCLPQHLSQLEVADRCKPY